jgi:hypothetical protein
VVLRESVAKSAARREPVLFLAPQDFEQKGERAGFRATGGAGVGDLDTGRTEHLQRAMAGCSERSADWLLQEDGQWMIPQPPKVWPTIQHPEACILSPELHRRFEEMCSHYGTSVQPPRRES